MKNKIDRYEFKKGDEMNVDEIYDIQGIGEANWWEFIDEVECEEIIITKNIKFTIKVYYPKNI